MRARRRADDERLEESRPLSQAYPLHCGAPSERALGRAGSRERRRRGSRADEPRPPDRRGTRRRQESSAAERGGVTVEDVKEPGPKARGTLVTIPLAALGMLLGMLALGETRQGVGPFDAVLTLRPALTGDSRVDIPPLGSLLVDTHDGPVRLEVQLHRLRPEAAKAVARDPSSIEQLDEEAGADLREAVQHLVLKTTGGMLLGGTLLPLLAGRRRRDAVLSSSVALLTICTLAGTARVSWDTRALSEPRYEGLLASAPAVVGNAEDVIARFDEYNHQLAGLVENVAKLYAATSTLPITPSTEQLRVLHVADIHSNPSAYLQVEQLVEQFDVSVVLDSGDSTDRGEELENRGLAPIGEIGVPWVWVKGNHDSAATVAGMKAVGAVVLEGEVVTVAGLQVAGAPDPRYTSDIAARPDRATEEAMLEAAARRLRQTIRADPADADGFEVDVALGHDPVLLSDLDGLARLALSGHRHKRERSVGEEGTRFFTEGTTGAAGLRGLETAEPTPMMTTILHLDKTTHALVAWDEITLGGLGDGSVTVRRRVVGQSNDESNSEGRDGSGGPVQREPASGP